MVYRARHVLLDAEVAIKVLLKPQDQDAQYRFLQEAQLAKRVKHPNTVVVSDFGVLPDDRSFLAMEFLRGPVLSKVISQGPLEPLRMCRIAVQIARGLQAVHDKGSSIVISSRTTFFSSTRMGKRLCKDCRLWHRNKPRDGSAGRSGHAVGRKSWVPRHSAR